VAQFARVLGTLLVGGIPLLQALDTASSSLGTRLLKKTLGEAGQMVKEGQSLSTSLAKTKVFPGLSIDMIEVGESTGALPQMLASIAEHTARDAAELRAVSADHLNYSDRATMRVSAPA